MVKYRFTLDGTLLTRDPEGWDAIVLTLERNKDIAGLLSLFTSELIFKQDGYDILKSELDNNNYNNKLTVLIEEQNASTWSVSFEGVILIANVIYNLDRKEAKATVEDSSFFGGIEQNKNIKAIIESEFSKNEVKLTAVSQKLRSMFNPATGFFYGPTNITYLATDVLDFLVRFMTDNEVKGITSTYLTTTSNFDGIPSTGSTGGLLYLVTGQNLREFVPAPTKFLNVSFADLFRNLQRLHNLSFDFTTNSAGETVMRIEELDFFFQQSTTLTIRNIKDLQVTINRDKLFSRIDIGSQTSTTGSYPAANNNFWTVFKQEDYYISGRSNSDTILDLTTDFITDSNVIEDVRVNGVTTHDDKIFIVTCDAANATRDTLSGAAPFHFNHHLTNDKIIKRQIAGIPDSVIKHFTGLTAKCLIGLDSQFNTSNTVIPTNDTYEQFALARIPFNNEVLPNYDDGNNYDTGDSFYSCPATTDLTFTYTLGLAGLIELSQPMSPFAAPGSNYFIDVVLQRFSPGFTVLQEEHAKTGTIVMDFEKGQISSVKTTIITDQQTMSCTVGDLIVVKIRVRAFLHPLVLVFVDNTQFAILGSTFECTGQITQGGGFQAFDPANSRVVQYSFRKNLSLSDFNIMKNNNRTQIVINEGNDPSNDRQVWIDRVAYNREKSTTDFELIT